MFELLSISCSRATFPPVNDFNKNAKFTIIEKIYIYIYIYIYMCVCVCVCVCVWEREGESEILKNDTDSVFYVVF